MQVNQPVDGVLGIGQDVFVQRSDCSVMVLDGVLDFVSWVFVVFQAIVLSMIFGTRGRAEVGARRGFGRVRGEVMMATIRRVRRGRVTVVM